MKITNNSCCHYCDITCLILDITVSCHISVIGTDHRRPQRRAGFSETLAFRGVSRAAPWA